MSAIMKDETFDLEITEEDVEKYSKAIIEMCHKYNVDFDVFEQYINTVLHLWNELYQSQLDIENSDDAMLNENATTAYLASVVAQAFEMENLLKHFEVWILHTTKKAN